MPFPLLQKPFPVHEPRWYRLRAMAFGGFIFCFLFLFKPFRMDLFTPQQLLGVCSVYGMVTAAVLLAGGWAFTRYMSVTAREDHWTLGKQVLWNMALLICIALLNAVVTQWMHAVVLPFYWYFIMLKWVVMLGVLPIVIGDLISYNYYLRQHLREASGWRQNRLPEPTRLKMAAAGMRKSVALAAASGRETNHIAGNTAVVALEPEPDCLVLKGDNQGDWLRLPAERLLAVQALDNYVNVFWETEQKMQASMLRTTLTNIAAALPDDALFYRTHRGWIVNTQRVRQVAGNAQGLKLTVDLLPFQVPVSRNNIEGYRQVTTG